MFLTASSIRTTVISQFFLQERGVTQPDERDNGKEQFQGHRTERIIEFLQKYLVLESELLNQFAMSTVLQAEMIIMRLILLGSDFFHFFERTDQRRRFGHLQAQSRVLNKTGSFGLKYLNFNPRNLLLFLLEVDQVNCIVTNSDIAFHAAMKILSSEAFSCCIKARSALLISTGKPTCSSDGCFNHRRGTCSKFCSALPRTDYVSCASPVYCKKDLKARSLEEMTCVFSSGLVSCQCDQSQLVVDFNGELHEAGLDTDSVHHLSTFSPAHLTATAAAANTAPVYVLSPAEQRSGKSCELASMDSADLHTNRPITHSTSGPCYAHCTNNKWNILPCRSTTRPARHLQSGSAVSRILLLLFVWVCSAMGSTIRRYDHSDLPSLSASPNIPASEMSALYDLYTATNGPDWRWSDYPSAGVVWNFTNPSVNNPCVDHWQGINCSFASPSQYYYVVEIILPSYNLTGKLPYSLDTLQRLKYINLNSNKLTGPVPASLGNLTNLLYLALIDNFLTDTIPAELCDLINLQYLSLGDNNLAGFIPASLGNLTSLQYLDLNNNHLMGPIPESLGNLTNLQKMDLHSNDLTSTIPESLGKLTYLTNLDLSYNDLTGSIPESLGNLTNLQYLDLSTCQFTGAIPASLGNLINLQNLYLYNNHLTRSLPESLGNLIYLQDMDLHSNQLTGSIPESLGNLIFLQDMDLHSNQLTGSLPESLGNLTNIQYLYLSINQLAGPMPESLGNFTNLQDLDLGYNQLAGLIPESLGNLINLQDLDLSANQLTGPIPATLDDLTNLQGLYLDYNQLTGSIPASLGNRTQLQYLDLNNNHLTGPIPESLGNLTYLQNLYLYNNQLTGPIPESLGSLINLQDLYLSYNQLNGPIPESLGNLTHLRSFDLSTNWVIGTMPKALGKLINLQYLNLSRNELIGSIPTPLGYFTNLHYLDLSTNHLRGTIPESLGWLTNLLFLDLSSNQLTHCIPESLRNCSQLQYLYLYSNHLTGTIPLGFWLQLQQLDISSNKLSGILSEFLGNLLQLQYLSMGNNRLTGTIPASFGNLSQLQYLDLHSNRIKGTIPSLASVQELRIVQLQNNSLTGKLDGVFDPNWQLEMEMIILNNNQLTGALPAALFQLNLKSLATISNCFKGPLPVAAMCNSTNMQYLILDGLSSATSCQNILFHPTYTLEHDIGGSIPTCLFELPSIVTLHLSGNGFKGSLSSDLVLSSTLTSLSLSHNELTGSIPEQIQLRQWRNIDLSYNRLSGTLVSNFASYGSVHLEDNRLSGKFPESFQTLPDISVLGSNMFSCSYDESDLPQNDKYRERYHCGSNAFNSIYFAWLGMVACALLILGYYKWKYRVFLNLIDNNSTLARTNLHTSLTIVCHLTLTAALYSIVFLLPLYCICNMFYGTQTFKYAYQVSAVFMSGVVPFILSWSFWSILLLIMTIATKTLRLSVGDKFVSQALEGKRVWTASVQWRAALYIFIPYLVLDCIVVVFANAAYVYVAVYKSRSLLLGVQTILSIFKIVWGRWTLPYVLAILTGKKKYGKVQVIGEILVNMLNNIVIPCLVVVAISPNCFFYALEPAPTISSVAVDAQCVAFNTTLTTTPSAVSQVCLAYVYTYIPTSYHPPFSYNYQCSASLITYYAPAFMSMCIVSTFIIPLGQYICLWLYKYSTAYPYWHRLLGHILPKVMKPADLSADISDNGYLRSSGLMTTLIGTLALILTFGVMFPPLCIALAVTVLATVYQYRLNVRTFISSATEQQRGKLVALLREECDTADSMQLLKHSVWVLVTISCWFYTLFLFDTLGDAVGFNGAYWVLIVMPLMPLVLYGVYAVVYKYCIQGREWGGSVNSVPDRTIEDGAGVEMQSMSVVVHNVLIVGEDKQNGGADC